MEKTETGKTGKRRYDGTDVIVIEQDEILVRQLTENQNLDVQMV